MVLSMDECRKRYNLVVLGGGQAGYYTAMRAAQLGLKTALIEENRIGGGAVESSLPLRALRDSYKAAVRASRASRSGLHYEQATFNPEEFHDHVAEQSDVLSARLLANLKSAGVDVFIGRGVPRMDHTVAVIRPESKTRMFAWDKLVIATGGKTSAPDALASQTGSFLTRRNLGQLDYLPDELLIYGEGPLALEAAAIYSGFGAKVSLIASADEFVPGLDEDLEHTLIKNLVKRGVSVYQHYTIKDAYRDSSDIIHLNLIHAGEEKSISGSDLLVLTNPVANLAGLDYLHFQTEHGHIPVNEAYETEFEGVYSFTASPDATDNPERLKQASLKIAESVAGKSDEQCLQGPYPVVVDSVPQAASIGLTKREAHASRADVRVGRFPLRLEPSAGTAGDARGFVELIIDGAYNEILGAHALAPNAVEIIHLVQTVMRLEGTLDDLIALPLSSDSSLEALQEAARDVRRESLYKHGADQ